jgi:transposase
MSELAMVGIDLGKHSFHLHGQDKPGREAFRKKLSRQQMMRYFSNLPPCTVVMEACAGAHFVAHHPLKNELKPNEPDVAGMADQ